VVALSGVDHFLGAGALRKQILFDVSADIHPGELVMVMGPSGSGKTTLLTLMGALRTTVRGSLRVLGAELRGANSAALIAVRQRIGFIFQTHLLLESLSARQNVQMALGASGLSRRECRRRAGAMLEKVGLAAHVESAPAHLSVGQRQRVAVARALVRNPELVLADEPTSALDRQSGRDVVELLRRLARERGCAVVIVTHDNRVLDVADRLMYLEDGRLSSFAPVTSAHAAHVLTTFRPLIESGHLGTVMARIAQPEFVEMLRALGAEAEQFLNTLDFGDTASAPAIFRATTEAVLERAVALTGASAAHVWVNAADGGLTYLCGYPALPAPSARAENALCVPLLNREMEVFALAELHMEIHSPEAERVFRDFARPLGLLAQVCRRLA